MENSLKLDIETLSRQLASRELTSQALVEAALERINALNPNAWNNITDVIRMNGILKKYFPILDMLFRYLLKYREEPLQQEYLDY